MKEKCDMCGRTTNLLYEFKRTEIATAFKWGFCGVCGPKIQKFIIETGGEQFVGSFPPIR